MPPGNPTGGAAAANGAQAASGHSADAMAAEQAERLESAAAQEMLTFRRNLPSFEMRAPFLEALRSHQVGPTLDLCPSCALRSLHGLFVCVGRDRLWLGNTAAAAVHVDT